MLTDKKLIKKLLAYMKPFKKQYIIGIIIMVFSVLCDLASPVINKFALDELGNENGINIVMLCTYYGISLLLIIASQVFGYFQALIMHQTGCDITYNIREDVFKHIQSLSHHQFSEIPVGTLVTRNTSDTNVIFQLYTNVIILILKNILTLTLVLIIMFIYSWELSLIVVIALPIVVTITFLFRKYLRVIHREVRTEVSSMNAFLSENISGMKVTQIFNQEDKKYKEFKEANGKLRKSSLKEIFTFGIFRPSVYLTYILTVIFVMYFGAKTSIANVGTTVITFSLLYTFYTYIERFFNPIQSLADQYNTLQSSFAAAEKIFTILDIKPEIVDSEDAIDIDLVGNIEFKNVWFAYTEGLWILKDVSFSINAKDVVAFVGATGAGKSTILGLITRNYDIQKGQILIDGIDIKNIKISSLRGQIGQMLQDVFLFSGNIADNIRLNDESITDEDIISACEEVNAMHFINKNKDGIYAPVGERGNNLSLGERQLISFARTIVHKPKLMILDEATSNIDTETEKLIQDTLEHVIKNNTMIMVAHRLSTIQHANKIFVFDHGEIIESGSHQELLKQRGRYYQLYMLQYQKNELINKN